jgi:aspartate kinase
VAHDTSTAKITVRSAPDTPGVAAALFRPLADQGVTVDMIVQNVSSDGATDISFTIPLDLLHLARPITEAAARKIGATSIEVDDHVGQVSIVGSGMRAHPGVAATMFSVLADAGINIATISRRRYACHA